MQNDLYPTKQDVMRKAQELVKEKKAFHLLDYHNRLNARNKGDLGQIVEEGWFHYSPNSSTDPDFKEAGVELKVSPYKVTRNGRSAKERLVCDVINYMDEVNVTFETSSFWKKCQCILLLSYCWKVGVEKKDFYIDKATLIDGFPEEDLLIIKHDWEIIIEKIRAGKAEELSEGDTMYLSACTKGTGAGTMRKQPFSKVLAKQRAYSLKTTYMTKLIRQYVFGVKNDEHIISDWKKLEKESLETIILNRFNPYIGMEAIKIIEKLNIPISLSTYQRNWIIAKKMLGLEKKQIYDEFLNANITLKTIELNHNGNTTQTMSFPDFSFLELIKEEEWEESEVYNQIVTAKFLFVVFQRDKKGSVLFKKAAFWNMPSKDVQELRSVWERTKKVIQDGVQLVYDPIADEVSNNLPKMSESNVAHVRSHGKTGYKLRNSDGTYFYIGNYKRYGDELPDGQWMTKQSFYLNKKYIKAVLKSIMKI